MLEGNDDFMKNVWERVAEKEAANDIYRALQLKETANEGFFYLLRSLGPEGLMFGMWDVLAVAFFAALLLVFIPLIFMGNRAENINAIAFMSAPFFYGLVFFFGLLKERQCRTYILEMSCKYTFFHVLSARMLFCSLLGMVFNFAYVLVLALRYDGNYVRLFALSFSALMLFSLLLSLGLEWGKSFLWAGLVGGLWIVLNLMGMLWMRDSYEALLLRLPLWALAAVGMGAAVVYGYELRCLIARQFRRGYLDA